METILDKTQKIPTTKLCRRWTQTENVTTYFSETSSLATDTPWNKGLQAKI